MAPFSFLLVVEVGVFCAFSLLAVDAFWSVTDDLALETLALTELVLLRDNRDNIPAKPDFPRVLFVFCVCRTWTEEEEDEEEGGGSEDCEGVIVAVGCELLGICWAVDVDMYIGKYRREMFDARKGESPSCDEGVAVQSRFFVVVGNITLHGRKR